MSNEEKKRRCKSCGKLLLDEKLPWCRRCRLEGRNKKVGQSVECGTTIVWLFFLGRCTIKKSGN